MSDGRRSSPTRSVFLELKDERDLIREGYEFLDEKRMIVAQEILRRLQTWKDLRDTYQSVHADAVEALAGAVARHGLDGLMVYPRTPVADWSASVTAGRFLGVELLECRDSPLPVEPSAPPVLPSSEAEQCREHHATLCGIATRLAIAHANLERLIAEYLRTERRARALENVLLPEIEETLRFVDDQLEAFDLEEIVRSRFTSGRQSA